MPPKALFRQSPPPARRVMSTLHDAIRRSAHGWMMKIIADGADVSKEMDGYTPLRLAACSGELSSINILLDNGADVDGLDCLPLRVTFSSQHYAAVVSLLANGASVPDDDYRLPDKSSLMSALEYGWIDVAKAIIRRMEDRPGRSHTFAQALLKAIRMNSKAGEELVQLLSDGADVTYPLHDAACADMVVSKYLIALGADVNAKDNSIVRGSDMGYGLEKVSLKNDMKDVAELETLTDLTPLSLAVRAKRVDIVNALLAAGAKSSSETTSSISKFSKLGNLGPLCRRAAPPRRSVLQISSNLAPRKMFR